MPQVACWDLVDCFRWSFPPEALFSWTLDGLRTLVDVPPWAQLWWALLSALAVFKVDRRALAITAVLPLLTAWMIAAMFGGRVEARYFSAPMVAALPPSA